MTTWQYCIVIAIGMLCFTYGCYLGYSHGERVIARLEQRNDELIRKADERLWYYKQAAAIARAFLHD